MPSAWAAPRRINARQTRPFTALWESCDSIRPEHALADGSSTAGISRRVHLSVEHGTNALERFFLGQLRFVGKNPRGMPGDIGNQHTPRLRVVEGATERNVQAAFDDGSTQYLYP